MHEAGDDNDDGSHATSAAKHGDTNDRDVDAASHLAQDVDVSAEIGGATEHADHVVAAEYMDGVGATEHADSGADIVDSTEQVLTDAPDNASTAHIFRVTISLRDDWLHRGSTAGYRSANICGAH